MKYASLIRAIATASVLAGSCMHASAQKLPSSFQYQVTVTSASNNALILNATLTTDSIVDQYGALVTGVTGTLNAVGSATFDVMSANLGDQYSNMLYSVADGATSWVDERGIGVVLDYFNDGSYIVDYYFNSSNLTTFGPINVNIQQLINGVATGSNLAVANSAPIAAVPEPASYAVCLLGLMVAGSLALKRRPV